MNKTKTKLPTGEGWAIHIYDSDRHLKFILEPSHIWTFGWGIGVGLLIAIVWSAIYSSSNNSEHSNRLLPTTETTIRQSLQVDNTDSFPFGID